MDLFCSIKVFPQHKWAVKMPKRSPALTINPHFHSYPKSAYFSLWLDGRGVFDEARQWWETVADWTDRGTGHISFYQLKVTWPERAFQMLSLHFNVISICPVSMQTTHSHLEVMLGSGGYEVNTACLHCGVHDGIYNIHDWATQPWEMMRTQWGPRAQCPTTKSSSPWRVMDDFLVGIVCP